MKAARLHSYGDIDQFAIDDIPIPEPAGGEILIKIEASAVNPFDLMVRKATWPSSSRWSCRRCWAATLPVSWRGLGVA